ncbi:hypothetical protein [Halomonas sp. A11-A]|jgi:hypothetical protein|uniref:hypothetical protein n=1 Tax=Halomonas sp. A11-A TaxID=2183985 RepID=UPI000D70A273|nr:hypothetical protein [Halomonas sp. A11-A]PWV71789.1 hypothetical protein DER72_12011 [Halomonas sp. A11-A]
MADVTGCILIDARSAGSRLPRQLSVVAPLARTETFSLAIIDDTGDARLPRMAHRYGTRLLSVIPAPLGQRLNDAIAHSHGPVLIFPGTGNATSSEALSRLAAEVAAGRVDVALLPTLQRGPLRGLLAWLRRSRLPRGEGLCLSRAWFERIGGCDPALDDDALDELLERLRACGARTRPTDA